MTTSGTKTTSSEDVPTREYPFGKEGADTLVVSLSPEHRQRAVKGLGLRAHYVIFGTDIRGGRYRKIIILGVPSLRVPDAYIEGFLHSCRAALTPENEGIHVI